MHFRQPGESQVLDVNGIDHDNMLLPAKVEPVEPLPENAYHSAVDELLLNDTVPGQKELLNALQGLMFEQQGM